MKKRRHHYVPQFYLRNFVDKKLGKIWVYTKDGALLTAASPRDVAVEKDYHTITTAEGIRDSESFEDVIGSLENVAAPVVQKIIRGSAVDFDDRQLFAVFAAQMLLRVPSRRDEAGKMVAGILDHMAKGFASDQDSFHADYRHFQLQTGDTSDLDPETIRQFILGGEYELKVKSSAALGFSLSGMDMVANCLVRMEWVFLRRSGRFAFLTCDNPVFYRDPTLPPNTWRGVGLMNRNVEVSFPLSPDILAFGSYHPKARARIEITPEVVRRFNQQTIDSAYRQIFADEKSEKLQVFIRRNNDRTAPVEPYIR